MDIPEQQSLSIRVFNHDAWASDSKIAETRILLGDLLTEIQHSTDVFQNKHEKGTNPRDRPLAKRPVLTEAIQHKIIEEEFDSMMPKEQRCTKWVSMVTVVYDQQGNERRYKNFDQPGEAEILLECSYRQLGLRGEAEETARELMAHEEQRGSFAERATARVSSVAASESGWTRAGRSQQRPSGAGGNNGNNLMYMLRRFPPVFLPPKQSGPLFLLRVAVDTLSGVYDKSHCKVGGENAVGGEKL